MAGTARETSTHTTNRQTRSPSTGDALTFNVAGLLGEAAGSVRDLEVTAAPLDLGPDLRLVRGLEGHLRLTRTNRGLLIHGRLSTAIAQTCSRCLRDLEWPVEIELAEEALPSVDPGSGLALNRAAEPDVLRLNERHELELEGEVRDAVVLAEPIAPLCREDCPGLCPVCGEELVAGPHVHPEAEIDPRLEGLRELIDQGSATDRHDREAQTD
jgi:uncharacterized protein